MTKTLVTTLLLLVVWHVQAQTPEQSRIILRLSQQVIRANSYFNASPINEREHIRTNAIYLTSLAAEYKLSKRASLYAVLPVFARSVVNELRYNQSGTVIPGRASNTLGDADILFRYTVYSTKSWQIRAQGGIGLPLGKRGDVTREDNTPTGDGEFNQLIGIDVRKSFTHFFFAGNVFFNNRSRGYSNEIRYGFDAGYSGNTLRITGRYRVIESLFNDTAVTSRNGIFSNHREAFMPGVEVLYRITPGKGIFASADFIIAGRNTLAAPVWGAGIEIKF